jgi:hypothetical protein
MYHITTLGRDPHGNPSSQPPFKSGVNRGYRNIENDGSWLPTGCYTYESRVEVQTTNWDWIRTLLKIGIKIGYHDYEGVRNFYVFHKNNVCEDI